MGVHGKIQVLGGWGFTKSQYIAIYRGDCLKRGTWAVCNLRGGAWQERQGWCIWGWGVDTPMYTMGISPTIKIANKYGNQNVVHVGYAKSIYKI